MLKITKCNLWKLFSFFLEKQNFETEIPSQNKNIEALRNFTGSYKKSVPTKILKGTEASH